jgi:hypothetical protein
MKLRLRWKGESLKNRREGDSCEAKMVCKNLSGLHIEPRSPDIMAPQTSDTTPESLQLEVSNMFPNVFSSIVLSKLDHFSAL